MIFLCCTQIAVFGMTDEEKNTIIDAVLYGHMQDFRERLYITRWQIPDKIEAHGHTPRAVKKEDLSPAQIAKLGHLKS
jgi:hypothetical protein